MGSTATGTMKMHRNQAVIQGRLLSQRQELAASIGKRLENVAAPREHDDEGGIAVANYTRDLTAAALERERRTLQEIEAALIRMTDGSYGVCKGCDGSIPEARLEALPWAHLCVHCAERQATRNYC
jgi:DnaK suppressor protein